MIEKCWEYMVEAALRGGATINAFGGNFNIVDGDPSRHPHTDVDLATDKRIREVLKPCLEQGVGILSEEEIDDKARLDKEWVLIVDPIDGTRGLLRGSHDVVVSIGLAKAGRMMAGVIYNPFTNEMWIARRGQGASLNGVQIHVAKDVSPDKALFLVSNSENEWGWLKPLEGRVRYTPRGSIAYKIVLVATGRGHAHITANPRNEWDVAAASLILEEAGGKITDRDGNPLVFNKPTPQFKGIVAAAPEVHPLAMELVSLLKRDQED